MAGQRAHTAAAISRLRLDDVPLPKRIELLLKLGLHLLLQLLLPPLLFLKHLLLQQLLQLELLLHVGLIGQQPELEIDGELSELALQFVDERVGIQHRQNARRLRPLVAAADDQSQLLLWLRTCKQRSPRTYVFIVPGGGRD